MFENPMAALTTQEHIQVEKIRAAKAWYMYWTVKGKQSQGDYRRKALYHWRKVLKLQALLFFMCACNGKLDAFESTWILQHDLQSDDWPVGFQFSDGTTITAPTWTDIPQDGWLMGPQCVYLRGERSQRVCPVGTPADAVGECDQCVTLAPLESAQVWELPDSAVVSVQLAWVDELSACAPPPWSCDE